MLLILPVMAQAEIATWKEIGATDKKIKRVVNYNVETLILDSGLECTIIATSFSMYGMSTWGGGGGCNFQLYNCLYHGLCGGGGSQTGATVNITHIHDKSDKGKRVDKE